MKWSFKLGRFLGIDVFVHFTFLIVLAIVGIAHWLPQGSLVQAFWGMVFFALLFLCVLLHEYGHALMARRFGVGTRDITLLPIGGVARLERIPEKPSQELLVALAGPAVNVVIALGLAAWLTLAQAWEPVSALGIAEGGLIERLLAVNIGLVLFNLLPAFPMDGGRVLRAVLAMKMDYARATSIAATVGKGMAIVFAMAGLIYNPMLILIAVFVWSGAAQEASMAQVRAVVSGACVREAMVTRFHTVPASATLQDLAALMLSGAQHDYPVMKRERIIGMLAHADILDAMRHRPMDTTAGEIMREDFATVEEAELLDDILQREREDPSLALPVMNHGMLTGLLTNENLHEYIIIREATGSSGHHDVWRRGVRVIRVQDAT
ncbi:site-2 protease family protein [Prosthecobacter sp.]|jgi:Zn-dependent protease/predicted transcriptional regulator|uniref:site-2 protease family protein n=1 Tax=Prosthecobacter sp. TaxID=1965333 RepID=UPI0037847842